MVKLDHSRRSFFFLLLESYFDLDKSLKNQIEFRKLERQLLSLVYLVSCALLISKIPSLMIDQDYYSEPAIKYAKLTSLLVAHVFFLPIFLYLLGFIIHWLLLLVGSKSTYFHTRLAFLWSLSLGSPIILLASLVKTFVTNSQAQFLIILSSELMVIFIFSRMLSCVSQFNNQRIMFASLVSIYIFLNVIITSYN